MYDPFKDYGGYKGRKPANTAEALGSGLALLLVAGLVNVGEWVYDKLKGNSSDNKKNNSNRKKMQMHKKSYV